MRDVNQNPKSLDVLFSVIIAMEDADILVRFIHLVLLLQIKDVKKVFRVSIELVFHQVKVIVWRIKEPSAFQKMIVIQDFPVFN